MNNISFPKLGIKIDVSSVLIQIGNFTIRWYGFLIALGLLLAILYLFKNSKRFGLVADNAFDIVLFGIIGGIVGARLYYVIFSPDILKGDFLAIFRIWEGGLAIYGGVIGGFLAAFLANKFYKIKLLPLFDIASIGFLIGQGIGRWGNFFNHEAFGTNTTLPWGMWSPRISQELSNASDKLIELGVDASKINPSNPVHPCFLYEFIWCAIGFFLLNSYIKKRKFDGEIMLMYIGWYGLGRFVIEGLRYDSLLLGKIRVSQLLAALCVIASVALILIIRSKIKRKGDPKYLRLYVKTKKSRLLLQKAELERENLKQKKLNKGVVPSEIVEEEKVVDDTTIEEKVEGATEDGSSTDN